MAPSFITIKFYNWPIKTLAFLLFSQSLHFDGAEARRNDQKVVEKMSKTNQKVFRVAKARSARIAPFL